MSQKTHEAVWEIASRAGYESKNGDVEDAFLRAVKKHGTRVFPSSTVREDYPWFDEYFDVFREAFRATYK